MHYLEQGLCQRCDTSRNNELRAKTPREGGDENCHLWTRPRPVGRGASMWDDGHTLLRELPELLADHSRASFVTGLRL